MQPLDYYTLTLRFGIPDEHLVGRYQVSFLTDQDVGMLPIVEYFTKLPFTPEVSLTTLINDDWLFVVSKHARDIRWTFLSPVITPYMLRSFPTEAIGRYLAEGEKAGMLPEPLAWFDSESQYGDITSS